MADGRTQVGNKRARSESEDCPEHNARLIFCHEGDSAPSDITTPIALDASQVYVVGREEPETGEGKFIKLDSCEQVNMISRQHAEIRFARDKGVWTIIDLKSTNGLLVNGRRVLEAQLDDGIFLKCCCVRESSCAHTW